MTQTCKATPASHLAQPRQGARTSQWNGDPTVDAQIGAVDTHAGAALQLPRQARGLSRIKAASFAAPCYMLPLGVSSSPGGRRLTTITGDKGP
jgi:hypothetical protein